jgi:hypothetical protein
MGLVLGEHAAELRVGDVRGRYLQVRVVANQRRQPASDQVLEAGDDDGNGLVSLQSSFNGTAKRVRPISPVYHPTFTPRSPKAGDDRTLPFSHHARTLRPGSRGRRIR